MKNPGVIIALIIILGLGTLVFAERQSIRELERQIAALKQDAEARAAEAANAQDELEKLRKKVADGKEAIAQLEARGKELAGNDPGAKAAPDGAAAADSGEGKNPFGKMIQKMFSDPNSKKMIRTAQMMGVKMMYSNLAKELGIGPDQANQVMEILGDRQASLTSKGVKMFGGESDDAATQPETTNEEYDAQLENILGKDGMVKLKEYERTVGDRMQIQQYQQAFNASGVPLDEKQSQDLLGIMKEERLKQPASPLDPGASDVGAAVNALQSEETFNALMTSQQDLNGRVLSRSRNVLSPDQMVQFEQIQKQQLDMQKMGLEMGRQFMKGK